MSAVQPAVCGSFGNDKPPPVCQRQLGAAQLVQSLLPYGGQLHTLDTMGAVHKGAALPWGSVQAETEPVERDLPVRLGLALGSRIEVRW